MRFNFKQLATVACVAATTLSAPFVHAQQDLSACQNGISRYQNRDYDNALTSFQTCLLTGNLSPQSNAAVHRDIGRVYNAKKDFTNAIQYFERAIALSPVDPWNDYVNRGNAWSGLGQFDKALADYETALKLKPDFNNAYFNRGVVQLRLGNPDKAKADAALAYEKGLRSAELLQFMAQLDLPTTGTSTATPPSTANSPPNYDKPLETTEELSGVLEQLARSGQATRTCFEQSVTLADFRPVVQNALQRDGIMKPSINQLAAKFYTLYPCPFSPNRPELKAAASSDVAGAWLYPPNSQKYRFPRNSPGWQRYKNMPAKCEGVGLFPGGEMRTMTVVGAQMECTIKSATDLEAIRRGTAVSSWSLLRDGRLKVSRTDVANHIEEWDLFVATANFQAQGLQVNAGDLIGYLRRERGNELNVATTFWHLQRLAN
jgi:tetratricopeptide (TPR) repeat protein